MRISVNVALEDGDSFLYTADAGAMQVLTALGGNATEDYCSLVITAPAEPGEAGVPPTFAGGAQVEAAEEPAEE